MVLSVLLEMYKGGNNFVENDNCDVLVIVGIRYGDISCWCNCSKQNLAYAISNKYSEMPHIVKIHVLCQGTWENKFTFEHPQEMTITM